MNELTELQLMEMRKRWYSEPMTLIEMVKNMGGREVAFLKCKTKMPLMTKKPYSVRCIKAHYMDVLLKNFEAFDFNQRPLNIYSSVAKFENMPVFSYASVARAEQQKAFFKNEKFDECFTEYDFVIDLDSSNLKKFKDEKGEPIVNAFDVNNVIKEYYDIDWMYEDAKKLKAVFDEFGLQYSIAFSGLKGMHFQIKDSAFFPAGLTPIQKVEVAKKIVNNLKVIEDIQCIDETIYDKVRIFKTPYSVDGYNIVLPLSVGNGFGSFNDWKIEDMRIDKVYQNVHISNRGLLERPKLKDSKEFIEVYGEVTLKGN